MIDYACIFTTGGVVLFFKAFCTLKFDALDTVIKKVLVQDKVSESKYFIEPYMVRWKTANDLGLIFAIVYQEIFQLVYVDDLLEMMKNEFKDKIYPLIKIENNFLKDVPSFENLFTEILHRCESKQEKNQKKEKIMRDFYSTEKGKKILEKKGEEDDKNKKKPKKEEKEAPNKKEPEVDNDKKNEDEKQPIQKKKSIAEILKEKQNKNKKPEKQEAEKKDDEPKGPPAKSKTQWNIPGKVDMKTMKSLDFSANSTAEDAIENAKKQFLGETPDGLEDKFIDDDKEIELSSDEEEPEEEIPKDKKPQKKGLFARFTSSIKNVTGNKVLEEEDLKPILDKFKEGLMEKNVAEEIAAQICDSIKMKLIDTKTKAFTSTTKAVKECLIESLTKILTPKRNIDVIADAMRAKESGRPYVIVFVGVNGVGKSTNLAKVGHLLKKKGGFSVMLAACDNFRAGAVEQIKTHGRCLEVPVYEKGYKNDPAIIAAEAIREATQRKIDCVLVDTAGRMQDNEPLMKALARLVALNQPDLVIFVGEALVGNDAVDQLTKFNKALIDLSPPDKIREIDAILLTKFDTVDDKVGAAVSMTYATGKPVLFVGTGQKYTHLRKLNVKTVVNTLLH